MSDLLNTGISALMGYRKALDTAGHNIANVGTDGYTRQRVEFVSRLGGPQGDGYIGSGVSTSTVKRITDAFVGARIVSDTSAYQRAASFESVVTPLDTWLSSAETGLSAPLSGFFDSLNDLSADPASTANRQSVISDAQSLTTRFHSLAAQIDGLQSEVNARMRQDVEEINAAARDIAALNERIALATGAAGGQPPNDLLDQRDQLIQQLAGKIGITTTEGDDGSISVFAGNGQGLVIGTHAQPLGVADDVYGSGKLDITFNGVAVTHQIGSGSLGGLLDAQREVIDPARARLGRLAIGLTETFNTQHRLGVDATGQAGGDFFVPLTAAGLGARTNTGTADVAIGFGDVSQLDDTEYELSFDGASWSLRNAATGASVAMTGDGSPGDPFVVGGLTFTVNGAAAAGDRFSLQPTARAAAD
ncbi:MAG: flagellar hook-associated protein FlgK, partial [Panacagrimonas sp.]